MSVYHRIFHRYDTSKLDFCVALKKQNQQKIFLHDCIVQNISLEGLLIEAPLNFNLENSSIIEIKNESLDFTLDFNKVWSRTNEKTQLLGIKLHFKKAATFVQWLKFIKELEAELLEKKNAIKKVKKSSNSVLMFHSGAL